MAKRRGLTIVYTGNGKGKTSAALGAALRALGHGWNVLMMQLFKGDWPVIYGEVELAKRFHPQFEVLQLIARKPPELYLILTGRHCPQPIIDRADLVTEMREIKHPWQQKIPAQAGIDY